MHTYTRLLLRKSASKMVVKKYTGARHESKLQSKRGEAPALGMGRVDEPSDGRLEAAERTSSSVSEAELCAPKLPLPPTSPFKRDAWMSV